MAEIIGKATVTEHLPKQETSCIVTILFKDKPPLTAKLQVNYTTQDVICQY